MALSSLRTTGAMRCPLPSRFQTWPRDAFSLYSLVGFPVKYAPLRVLTSVYRPGSPLDKACFACLYRAIHVEFSLILFSQSVSFFVYLCYKTKLEKGSPRKLLINTVSLYDLNKIIYFTIVWNVLIYLIYRMARKRQARTEERGPAGKSAHYHCLQ